MKIFKSESRLRICAGPGHLRASMYHVNPPGVQIRAVNRMTGHTEAEGRKESCEEVSKNNGGGRRREEVEKKRKEEVKIRDEFRIKPRDWTQQWNNSLNG